MKPTPKTCYAYHTKARGTHVFGAYHPTLYSYLAETSERLKGRPVDKKADARWVIDIYCQRTALGHKIVTLNMCSRNSDAMYFIQSLPGGDLSVFDLMVYDVMGADSPNESTMLAVMDVVDIFNSGGNPAQCSLIEEEESV